MKKDIPNKDSLREQYEDSLFKLLMDELSVKEGQRLAEENERLRQENDVILPDGLESRCEKTISDIFAAKKRKKSLQSAKKALGRVAVIVLVSGIVFGTLFSTVSAFRITVSKLFIQNNQTNTNITINDSGEQSIDDGNITIPLGGYFPTWLPSGYTLSSYNSTKEITKAAFSNSADNVILYLEFGNNEVLGVNSQGADNAESIKINGFDGLLVAKDDVISLTWADVDRGLLLRIRTTGIDKETVIRIAKSVKKN